MPVSRPPAASPPAARPPTAPDRPRRHLFLLVERFTLMSFAASIEPLRLANHVSGRKLYEWRLIGENTTVTCSNGTRLALDAGLEIEPAAGDRVLVCGGVDVARTATRPVLAWLRRAARKGVGLGGICTGAWVLARAGLLDGRRATIHWENHDGFAEAFPDVDLYRTVFVDDGNRLTASGGTAPADLMLRLIARDHGAALAAQVADQLIYTSIRAEGDTQRLSIPTRIGVRHPKLSAVIARIETTLEDPVSPARLAADFRHVHAPTGTAVRALSGPHAQAVLHGKPAEPRAQPADADRHAGDRGGPGLRLFQQCAFFQMLPRAIWRDAVSRTRVDRRADDRSGRGAPTATSPAGRLS